MLEKILLGTYTRGASQGIYTIELDTNKKALSNLTLVAKENSPTYLAQSQAKNLYNVTAVNDQGGVAAYNSHYHLLNTVTKTGAPLCFLAIDEKRQLVYGANYHKGEVNVYQILADGSLEATDSICHKEATGPHENQDHAHAHYAGLTTDGRLAVCDLGTDRIYTYDVSAQGKLTEVSQWIAPAGTGPRHLIFHPNGKIAYLFGELDSSVTVLSYDTTSASFTSLEKLPTIPEAFTHFNSGSAIRITKDGKFLYLSNRGHNSITVFAVNDSGEQLTYVQNIPTEGDFPRDFNLNADDHFLVCGHQNSDNLTLFERDVQTGQLTLIEKDIYAPECVCVLFAK